MTPQDAGAYLAVRASSRMWELPSWQTFYGLVPEDWPPFRAFVREVLVDGPLTRSELIDALRTRYGRVCAILAEGNDTILKPLSWQGDMALGPVQDGEATFVTLTGIPGWAGLPDLDDAGPKLVETFIRTYGPATAERVSVWFGEGLGAKRRDITRWLDQLKEKLEHIVIDGDQVMVAQEDFENLCATPASNAVIFVPGRDPWVAAPGTSDVRVIPKELRAAVTRSANLVIASGRIAGTWSLRGNHLEVLWCTELDWVSADAVNTGVTSLTAFLDRPLELVTTTA